MSIILPLRPYWIVTSDWVFGIFEELRCWRNRDESTFCTLIDDATTRIMVTCASSPDNPKAGTIPVTWRAVVSLGSHQLPIIVTRDRQHNFIISERCRYIDQKRRDWHGFREFTKRHFWFSVKPRTIKIGSLYIALKNICNAQYFWAVRLAIAYN